MKRNRTMLEFWTFILFHVDITISVGDMVSGTIGGFGGWLVYRFTVHRSLKKQEEKFA